ncbi:hypothetical protein [Nocardioides marmotae]|uniref:hypothetical protein n=1 Tax=Nocardioides marmotae TaxID=2663857 RepID=UPI0012B54388|nr:hypothetical protein [Nocardioides marmotae]MBC9731997.1 hypothetical protein [Nocardioides marmotae]MTB83118.1 hypothetical protein [Nocardioides marmotae]
MAHRLARVLGSSLLLSGFLTLLAALVCHVSGGPEGTHASAVWVLGVLGLLLIGNSLVLLVVESQVRAQHEPSAG